MKNAYLLDTNHLAPAVNPVSPLRERLYQARRRGANLGTCVPVLCELESGIQDTAHVDSYRRQLAHLLSRVRTWPLDLETARVYGDLFLQLRRRGRVLSQVDMLLAALALTLDVVLVTSDKDFAALPQVRTENWLPSSVP